MDCAILKVSCNGMNLTTQHCCGVALVANTNWGSRKHSPLTTSASRSGSPIGQATPLNCGFHPVEPHLSTIIGNRFTEPQLRNAEINHQIALKYEEWILRTLFSAIEGDKPSTSIHIPCPVEAHQLACLSSPIINTLNITYS